MLSPPPHPQLPRTLLHVLNLRQGQKCSFHLGSVKKKKKITPPHHHFISNRSDLTFLVMTLCSCHWLPTTRENKSQPSTIITIHPHTQWECTMQMCKPQEMRISGGHYGVWLLQLKGKRKHTHALRRTNRFKKYLRICFAETKNTMSGFQTSGDAWYYKTAPHYDPKSI